MPSWLNVADVISGFGGRSREIRKEETDRADKAFELERKTLEWLATSDDKEIRKRALTGILELSQPKRKGGLAGWFGQVEQHPAFDPISRMVNSQVPVEKRVPTPESGKPIYENDPSQFGTMVDNPEFQEGGPFGAGGPYEAPGGRMAALTGDGPTSEAPYPEVGTGGPRSRPPTTPQRRDPPPIMETGSRAGLPPPGQAPSGPRQPRQIGSVPAGSTTMTEMQDREVFYQPEERIKRNQMAQYQGRIEGLIEGVRPYGVEYTPEEIKRLAEGLGGHAARRTKYDSMSVQYKDGSYGVVSENDATGALEDEFGNDRRADIARIMPRTASANRPLRGIVPNRDGTYSHVEFRPNQQGGYDQIVMGPAPAPNPAMVRGLTPDGKQVWYRMPDMPGAPPENTGVGVPPTGSNIARLDPGLVRIANDLGKLRDKIDEQAQKVATEAGYGSDRRMAKIMMETQDRLAKAKGYPDYEALDAAVAAAQAAAAGSGNPGAAGGPPAGGGGVAGAQGVAPPPAVTPPVQAPPAAPTSPAPPTPAPVPGDGAPPPPGGDEFGTPQGADAIRRHLRPGG